MPGYWEPHTSSVDFCEPNYALTSYIAEPHNVWSSLVITLYGLFGLCYGNPLKEWSISVLYIIIAIIGLGSVGLHTTLHWLLQSSDEVPMLWMVLGFLHLLWIIHTTKPQHAPNHNHQISIIFFTVALIQTIFYYCNQQVYAVFIISMILYVTILIFTSLYMILQEQDKQLQSIELHLFLFAYIYCGGIALSLWILDMNICNVLLPYYMQYTFATGGTFHIIWHLLAGLESYCITVLLTVFRVRRLGYTPRIHWIAYCLPYCILLPPSKSQ